MSIKCRLILLNFISVLMILFLAFYYIFIYLFGSFEAIWIMRYIFSSLITACLHAVSRNILNLRNKDIYTITHGILYYILLLIVIRFIIIYLFGGLEFLYYLHCFVMLLNVLLAALILADLVSITLLIAVFIYIFICYFLFFEVAFYFSVMLVLALILRIYYAMYFAM